MGMAKLAKMAKGGIRDYYQKGVDDYYFSAQIEPELMGSGVEELGLGGKFSVEQWEALNQGENGHKRKARDLTFSPPKSVSIVYGLGSDQQRADMLEAHREAVRQSVDFIEDSGMILTRKREGENVRNYQASGIVVAGFEHAVSRELDPQLHTHALIANACIGPDGKVVNLNYREIYRHQKLIGKVYGASLAAELQKRGYTLREGKNGWEIARITDEQIREYSTRSGQIEDELAKQDLDRASATEGQKQNATLKTRKHKEEVELSELKKDWLQRAEKVGLDLANLKKKPETDPDRLAIKKLDPSRIRKANIVGVEKALTKIDALNQAREKKGLKRLDADKCEKIRDHETGAALREEAQGLRKEEIVRQAMQETAELNSTFKSKDVQHLALDLAEHERVGMTPKEFDRLYQQEAARAGTVSIPGQEDKTWIGHEYTTRDLVEAERGLIKTAQTWKGQMEAVQKPEQIEPSLANYNTRLKMDKGYELKPEQAGMVRHILGSRDLASMTQGDAGTGKTTALKAVAEIHGRDNIIGLAPQSVAAQILEKETGIKSMNVDQMLTRLKHGDKDLSGKIRGSLIVVDEAGMLGSRKMDKLLKVAEIHEARVALVGDTKQLAAVGAGEPVKLLQQRGAIETHRLADIRRQKNLTHREAVKDMAQGRVTDGLAKLDSLGAIKEIKKKRERQTAMAKEALESWRTAKRGQQVIVMTKLNADRERLNNSIRHELKQRGTIKAETERTLKMQDRRGWEKERNFAVGDRVVFEKNNKRVGVQNGHYATITGWNDNGQIIVKMDKGGPQKTIPSSYKQIDHAYCVTVHKGQGVTTYKAITDEPRDMRSTYVASSRSTDELSIYTADKAKLAGRMAKMQPLPEEKSALDRMEQGRAQGHSQDQGHRTPRRPGRDELRDMAKAMKEDPQIQRQARAARERIKQQLSQGRKKGLGLGIRPE